MTKLRPCKTCGKDIAHSARACPNCGAPQRRDFELYITRGIAIIAVVASASIVLLRQHPGPDGRDVGATSSPSSATAVATPPASALPVPARQLAPDCGDSQVQSQVIEQWREAVTNNIVLLSGGAYGVDYVRAVTSRARFTLSGFRTQFTAPDGRTRMCAASVTQHKDENIDYRVTQGTYTIEMTDKGDGFVVSLVSGP